MKITLRKKDSVTSIILFLFNLQAELSGKSTINLSQILEQTSYFGKTESAVRTCLSRMVAQKILLSSKEGSETNFCLSDAGLNTTKLWNRGMGRYFERMSKRHQTWDGQWHFISLREFNKSDYNNASVVEELRESGMREFSKGLWISPYPLTTNLAESLTSNDIRIWQISGLLLPDTEPEEWQETLFQLADTQSRYHAFLDFTDEVADALNSKKAIALLPELFHLGWLFFDIIVDDPVLPMQLLPIWEGDAASEKMRNLRGKIMEQLKQVGFGA